VEKFGKTMEKCENLGNSRETECTDRGQLEAKVKETCGKVKENLRKVSKT
jgi:uncharacterized protein YjbJ (UPF0337 family)